MKVFTLPSDPCLVILSAVERSLPEARRTMRFLGKLEMTRWNRLRS